MIEWVKECGQEGCYALLVWTDEEGGTLWHGEHGVRNVDPVRAEALLMGALPGMRKDGHPREEA